MARFKVVAESNFNDSAEVGLFIPAWVMENVTDTFEDYGNEAATSWAWETDDPKTVAALETALQAAPGILSYDTIEEVEAEDEA